MDKFKESKDIVLEDNDLENEEVNNKLKNIDQKEENIKICNTHFMEFLEIDINVIWVIKKLKVKGYQSYLTGKCIRDLILDFHPKSFNIITSAKSSELKEIFKNSRLVEKQFFLTFIFFPAGNFIKISTFSGNFLEQDLSISFIRESYSQEFLIQNNSFHDIVIKDMEQRDFTVSSLFYDPVKSILIDCFGSLDDFKRGIIRMIGNSNIKIKENPVKIIKGIKFASKLNFLIERKTLFFMKRYIEGFFKNFSNKLGKFFFKFLVCGSSYKTIIISYYVGVLFLLIPEIKEGVIELYKMQNGIQNFLLEHKKKYFKALLISLDKLNFKNTLINFPVALSVVLLPEYLKLKKDLKDKYIWINNLCLRLSFGFRFTNRDLELLKILFSTILVFSKKKIKCEKANRIIKSFCFRDILLLYIIHLMAIQKSFINVEFWKSLALNSQNLHKIDKCNVGCLHISFFKRKFSYIKIKYVII